VSTLVVPSDPATLAVLGPRITPQTVARLRRIACPTSAAALLLALATDARAGRVASCTPRSISPDSGQVGLLPGTYRVPAATRPLLRAALSSTRPAAWPPTPCSPTTTAAYCSPELWPTASGTPRLSPTCPSRTRPPPPGAATPSPRPLRHRPHQQRSSPDRRRRTASTATISPTANALTARAAITDISAVSH
jgi:hypothetical protein